MLGKFSFYLIDLLRGTSIMKALKELHVHQYLPKKELDAIRQQRLDALFNLATRHVAFYKNCRSYEAAPVLTKAAVMERYNDFFVRPSKKKLSKKNNGRLHRCSFCLLYHQGVSVVYVGFHYIQLGDVGLQTR